MKIVLTPSELLIAVQVAAMRRSQNLKVGRKPTYGMNKHMAEWDADVSGAAAEMAVSKAINVYWNGHIGDLNAPDAGPFDVRSTTHEHGSLILHEKDEDKRMVILAIGKDLEWRLAGWLQARDGKKQMWWREDTGRPAYFVPQRALRPMKEWRLGLLCSGCNKILADYVSG